MPGAGGKVAIAYLANAAPKDGTVISGSYPQALTEGALGRRDLVKYDTRALTFIGSMNGEPYYCFARTDAPAQTLEDVKTKELIVGATGQGSSSTVSPALLNNLVGTKFKVITGYPGSAEVILAVLKNEVHGWCGMGVERYPGLRSRRDAEGRDQGALPGERRPERARGDDEDCRRPPTSRAPARIARSWTSSTRSSFMAGPS